MKKPLRVIHLEDSSMDSELVQAMLEPLFDLSIVRVESEHRFEKELGGEGVDLIISDFTLPSYNGVKALAAARSKCPEVPFIFFSGTIGEEAAIETLTSGATDYILKHRPQKLIPAIERAIREREERTSRHNAEEALKRREEWFRVILENALDIVTILDRFGNFTYNSPSVRKVLGYYPEELDGVNAFSLIHEEDFAQAQKSFELALTSSEPITAEFRLRHKDGLWRTLELIGKGLPSDQHLGGIVINSRDVTEKRLTEAQLLRAQRMECLGVLAGGVAHDLNNILAPVMMGAELLRTTVTDEEALSIIETIEASAERGSGIVNQVLSFARGVKGDDAQLEIKPLVREVIKLLRSTLAKNIQIQTRFSDNLKTVGINPTELHQVLLNLCVNARDAMPDGGLLQVTAENMTLDKHSPRIVKEQHIGEFVRITVADTGTGIPSDLLGKIFEPFYTSKEEGKGTGLGLPTVLSIVKGNGGFINVESSLNQGSRFHVFLPSSKVPAPSLPAAIQPPLRGGKEKILFVDDESAILEIAKVILENSNYEVILAKDGVQALQLFTRPENSFDLVITDGSMPIMDGIALMKELRKIAPQVNVICATGEGSEGKRTLFESAGANFVLNKPYSADQLLNVVSQALGTVRTK